MYYWLPESLAVTGKQTVESRRVGIYSGQVWHNALQIKASFDPLRLAALRKTNIVLGQPRLVVSVGDARGIALPVGAIAGSTHFPLRWQEAAEKTGMRPVTGQLQLAVTPERHQ